MPSVKKEKPAHMAPEVIAAAHARVEADPRGAPITGAAITGDDIIVGETPLSEIEAYVRTFDAVMPARESEPIVTVAPVPCALQDAPVGSKIVTARNPDGRYVTLITPNDGSIRLPESDLSYTLPVGAKVRKRMAAVFEATELEPKKPRQPLVASTAADAITQFRSYFTE